MWLFVIEVFTKMLEKRRIKTPQIDLIIHDCHIYRFNDNIWLPIVSSPLMCQARVLLSNQPSIIHTDHYTGTYIFAQPVCMPVVRPAAGFPKDFSTAIQIRWSFILFLSVTPKRCLYENKSRGLCCCGISTILQRSDVQRPLLLKWFNFNHSMDK